MTLDLTFDAIKEVADENGKKFPTKQELKENLGKIREGIRETAAAADTPKEQTAKILRQMDSDEQERVIREVLKELLS